MPQKTDRRLYLTSDRSRVVEDGDMDATFLFAAEGDDVSDDDIKQYGLKFAKAAEKDADKAEKAASKAENKAESLSENKAEKPAENKGVA